MTRSALTAALAAAACGGAMAAPVSLATQLGTHNWRVRIQGCEGAMAINPDGTGGWGCAPPSTSAAPNPWPMFAGKVFTGAAGGVSLSLDVESHGYQVAGGVMLPDGGPVLGTLTGTFTDDQHFTGTITGWGAPIPITLELANI